MSFYLVVHGWQGVGITADAQHFRISLGFMTLCAMADDIEDFILEGMQSLERKGQ